MSFPHHLGGHAVLSIAYLINRIPNPILDFKTPHDVFGDHVSKVFGYCRYCSRRENDRLPRSGAEDDALGFKTTDRQDGHNWSSGSELEDDAHGFKMTGRQDGHDRSSGSESDDSALY
ncbi:unnamed protein product [Prunus armeniaca]